MIEKQSLFQEFAHKLAIHEYYRCRSFTIIVQQARHRGSACLDGLQVEFAVGAVGEQLNSIGGTQG